MSRSVLRLENNKAFDFTELSKDLKEHKTISRSESYLTQFFLSQTDREFGNKEFYGDLNILGGH